jgi:hypothetical protein
MASVFLFWFITPLISTGITVIFLKIVFKGRHLFSLPISRCLYCYYNFLFYYL